MGWKLTVLVLAVAAALIPLPPAVVERFYSAGLFSALQPAVTSASNRAPFALLDALIVVVGALWLALAARDLVVRATVTGAAGRIVLRTLWWAAAFYLVFLAAWGLNYRRVRLADKLAQADSTVDAKSVRAAVVTAVDRVNALYERAHAESGAGFSIDARLGEAFRRAAREVGASSTVVAGVPKRTLLDLYFRRAGVSGMTDPFFLETLVASDVLPFERPFVVAHEWSHLAGVADEGDANFVGWLACLHGTAADQYSAWLFFYQEAIAAVDRRDRAAVSSALGPGPRQDLRAARERLLRNVSPRMSAAGWRVYDSYLKANRVEAGAASYAEVVQLVVGTRFAADWTPVLR